MYSGKIAVPPGGGGFSERNASLYKSQNFSQFHNGISITCDIRHFILQVQLLQKIQETGFIQVKLRLSNLVTCEYFMSS
jgi:hypothetical protein